MSDAPTVFITGATDGLGRALAHRLAQDGYRLILHGRDPERLARIADEASSAGTPDAPVTATADLADLAQVSRLAEQVREGTDRLDVFVSNAGIGAGEPDGRDRRTSADGYELRFAVNHLAGFALTLDLLPLLRAGAPARVVYVASLGMHPLDFDDLMLQHGYDGWRAYGQSKLAQIMAGLELAERLPAAEVTVNSLHPGTFMPTKMVLAERGTHTDSLETGVEATHRMVASPELTGVTGAFFDRTSPALAEAQAYDRAARAQLWRRSLELVGRPDID
ncbi:SDR family NAD(P)-dependent oxidoreductase [Streptomonospora litoralis]|uniref:Rhamnolipids biosynthesis 3-oxoacyl-[acyl-carrier-protein] reductase n=1 Tax=Streptomonospora litoralis TaxID=2498135 RepID=A0A4P6Q703_9ACTN|nr:SDR family NAD(P)-dependent oxidoreductase [Streptomonospora litoralis]QBI56566.1 Rhamnolipids biosynthesis 3-oxoacyl-[acyl-carrier-protein] reductase [Streptomonospora litoralis]